MSLIASASQTVGPFFKLGLEALYRSEVAGPGVEGQRLTLQGRVLDGEGQPVSDAVLEIWQADAHGHYSHMEDPHQSAVEAAFIGFGRQPTDTDGRFKFTTIKPGRVPNEGGSWQAPHLNVAVFMRGLLQHQVTRVYFPDEAGNAEDPVLKRVPPERRDTLIARRLGDDSYLEWDVHMQGEQETVFFDF